MKVSKSTGYALLAASYIALQKDKGVVLSQHIAKEYHIPLEYLLKILQQMVRANILHSKRGPGGGFSLAKHPKKITLLDIIEAVEGPMAGNLNLARLAHGDKIGGKADQIYAKAVANARAVFKKARLTDLLRR